MWETAWALSLKLDFNEGREGVQPDVKTLLML